MLPERDYTFVSIGTGSATMAALLAKKIDAVPYYPPFTYELEKRGYPSIADEVTYVPQYVTGTHIVSRTGPKNSPRPVRSLSQGYDRNRKLVEGSSEREGCGPVVFQQYSLRRTRQARPAVCAEDVRLYIRDKRLSFDGYAPQSAVRANIAILKERGYTPTLRFPRSARYLISPI